MAWPRAVVALLVLAAAGAAAVPSGLSGGVAHVLGLWAACHHSLEGANDFC